MGETERGTVPIGRDSRAREMRGRDEKKGTKITYI